MSRLHGITEAVMAGLVPAIHAFTCCTNDVDARHKAHKAGHDDGEVVHQVDRNHL
jgi:hypothetical protein